MAKRIHWRVIYRTPTNAILMYPRFFATRREAYVCRDAILKYEWADSIAATVVRQKLLA